MRLFPVRGNGVEEETKKRTLVRAIEALKAMLPAGWEVTFAEAQGFDAAVIISSPDRSPALFFTEVRTGRVEGAEWVVQRLSQLKAEADRHVLLIGAYLGPALRQRCEDQGINYLDLTGWCWIQAPSPALVLRSSGAAKDPHPPRASIITRLNGASASRVIRTLLDTRLPVGVRLLAERALVSASTVSKVLKELDSEAIVSRDGSGAVVGVQKRHLLERWTRDYSFLKTNTTEWFLAPRGLQHVLKRVANDNVLAVGTGSIAARRLLPESQVAVTPLSQVALYVPDIAAAAEQLGLVPADRATANVILAEPYDSQLLVEQPREAGQLQVTEASQTIADLRTMPGRAPQEADQLMDYLASTDESWR